MPSLVAITGQSVDLPFKQVSIGSDPGCDIPMRADLGIAWQHVMLNVTRQGTWLQAPDLQQPVTVNGTRLVSAALKDGDVLTLGSVTLTFRLWPHENLAEVAPTTAPEARPEPAPLPKPPGTGYSKPAPKATPAGFNASQGAAPAKPQYRTICVYGIPIKITPMVSIITGILGVLACSAGIVYSYNTIGVAVKPSDLVVLQKDLLSTQTQRPTGPGGSSITWLNCADGEVFMLPSDIRLDLSTAQGRTIGKIGVMKNDYAPGGKAPSGHPLAGHVVTLEVNGRPWRTLARHNELKTQFDNVGALLFPAFGLACLWCIFGGLEKRAAERKNRW